VLDTAVFAVKKTATRRDAYESQIATRDLDTGGFAVKNG
jgi:hypothetical protein